MSESDRVALEGLRLFVRQVVREVLAEERPASPAATEGFVGTQEAAELLGVERAAVRAWIKSGRLQARKLPGVRGHKIRRSDLGAFVTGAHTGQVPANPTKPVDLTARRIAASIPRGGK